MEFEDHSPLVAQLGLLGHVLGAFPLAFLIGRISHYLAGGQCQLINHVLLGLVPAFDPESGDHSIRSLSILSCFSRSDSISVITSASRCCFLRRWRWSWSASERTQKPAMKPMMKIAISRRIITAPIRRSRRRSQFHFAGRRQQPKSRPRPPRRSRRDSRSK